MRVLISMRIILLMLTSLTLMAFQIEKKAEDGNSFRIKVEIGNPKGQTAIQVGSQSVRLPQIPAADFKYFNQDQTIRPVIQLPIVLPPTNQLPTIRVISQNTVPASNKLPVAPVTAASAGFEADRTDLNPGQAVQVMVTGQARDRRWGLLVIQPYLSHNKRLISIEFSVVFPGILKTRTTQKPDREIQSALNASMAQNWRIPPRRNLSKVSETLPAGTWYKFPVEAHGVYRITMSSFPGGVPVPNSNPNSWRLYAPYYAGKMLAQTLPDETILPPNLTEMAYTSTGLADGTFSGTDEIRFFARGPNGDFNGNEVTNPYSTIIYYWLLIPDDPNGSGRTIPVVAGIDGNADTTIDNYTETYYHENDLTNILKSGIIWLGEQFSGSGDVLTLTFPADYIYPGGNATLSGRFLTGAGTYTQTATILLNQTVLDQATIARNMYPLDFSGSATNGIVNEGSNQLRIEYQAGSNQAALYLDFLKFTYQRYLAPQNGMLFAHLNLAAGLNNIVFRDVTTDYQVWDISQFDSPRILNLSERHFQEEGPGNLHLIGFHNTDLSSVTLTQVDGFAPYKLKNPANQADYLIIAPKIFQQEAERVKDLRENLVLPEDRLNVKIAYLEDIYNEFAAGASDPTALHNFLSYAYYNWRLPAPRFVFLLGDADYDYRNLTGQSKILVPTWETDGTSGGLLSESATRASDDYFVYLQGGRADKVPDMAIGRFPARDLSSLAIMVDKLENYLVHPVNGIWSNTAILVGDDPLRPHRHETAHIDQCEDLAARLPASFIVNKIYLTEYPEVQDPTSQYVRKPAAREDLLQKVYDGAAIVTYMGHGSPTVWAQERVFTQNDLPRLNTGMKLPFWIAGTCDWGYFDDINSNCVPEAIMNMRDNGGIGILTATRLVGSYSNATLMRSLYENLFPRTDQSATITLGEAVQIAKAHSSSSSNDEKYLLFADPALKLASPRQKGTVTSITPSDLHALGKLNYAGLTQGNTPLNGQAVVSAFDSKRRVTRHYAGYVPGEGYDEGDISYILPGDRIFRGLISVADHQYQGNFTIPKDIRYSGRTGILNIQYWNTEGTTGVAFVDTLSFQGSDTTLTDETGPEIQFYSYGQPLRNGNQVLGNDKITIQLFDPLGINLTGSAGHGISLAVDDDWSAAIDVTNLFEYDINHTDQGHMDVTLNNVSKGDHTLSVKAWDNLNNPAISNIALNFTDAGTFSVVDVYNYPNPMTTETTFWFRITAVADVTINMYTLGGRKIRSLELGEMSRGYHLQSWDGRDSFGQLLANGVYLYVVEAKYDITLNPAQAIEKLVIAR